MTGFLSPGHIVILLIVLLLVFGAQRLPELGRSLGHGMREFKDSLSGDEPADPGGRPVLVERARADRSPAVPAQPSAARAPQESDGRG